MMRKFFHFFLLIGLFLSPALLHAAGGDAGTPASDFLIQGNRLFRSGDWDAAETAYWKAAGSPEVKERLKAYRDLVRLYRKVRVHSKADRTQQLFEQEKAFSKRLVPSREAFYEAYVVKKGETYGKIARARGISLKWLLLANGSKKLLAGDSIKVPLLRDRIIVSKSEFKLDWMRDNELVKTYAIAVGEDVSETPEGYFEITNKVKDPTWYYKKKVIPPGSPQNLLGTRWMGLNRKGYGIHGTREPESIGKAASHGCIRMLNRDVEELFSWVPVGASVEIRP